MSVEGGLGVCEGFSRALDESTVSVRKGFARIVVRFEKKSAKIVDGRGPQDTVPLH